MILVVVMLSMVFSYFYFKPGITHDIYTVTSRVKLGKIANTYIEPWGDLELYLRSKDFTGKDTCLSSLGLINQNNSAIQISYSSNSADDSFKCVSRAIDKII